ncbi:MAG TPA: hypothetical protein VK988_06125, partial [Acidimicrobiales bacterium]|nr:hypothetical protein [Acidimicrobiales bacterium]
RTAITGLADHPYTRLVEIPIQARPEGAPNARSITRDAASRQVSAIGAYSGTSGDVLRGHVSRHHTVA